MPRAALLDAWTRDLVELAALLVGEPAPAAEVVERARSGLWPRRDPERLREAARRAVLRRARQARSPWTRSDPLAPVAPADREVLALRATTTLSPAGVAHLLDVSVAAVLSREATGLAAAGCADLDTLRPLLRGWLDEVRPELALPARPEGGTGLLRPVAGLVAVAVLATAGVLAAGAVPTPPAPTPQSQEQSQEQQEQRDPDRERTPSAQPTGPCGAAEALCTTRTSAPTLPPAEGVDPRLGTPFWPFVSDRQAADWAVDPAARPWAADPVAVAQHLVDDLLRLPGLRAAPVGGGVVRLRSGGRDVATVRLARLGRGERRPWSVVQVRSAGVALEEARTLAPGQPVQGRAGGPVSVSLLDPSGRALARGDRLGVPLEAPDGWSVAALVAVRRDGSGLALQPVRRAGALDRGVPPAGSTFVSLVDGTVRLHDALTGQQLLALSSPSAGARDSDPSRGGRDGVVFVRTDADGCTTSVLRTALDRGAQGTTVQRAPVTRRLPRLSPSARWLGRLEQPCGGGPSVLVLRGPDARERRVDLGTRSVTALDVRDDGSAVLQLEAPDRVVDLPPGAVSLGPAVAVAPGCRATGAAAAGARLLVWERCGDTARPVLLGPGREVLGPPGPPVRSSAVVQAEDGPLVLAHTEAGAVARLVGGRLVEVVAPCRGAPGCLVSVDW